MPAESASKLTPAPCFSAKSLVISTRKLLQLIPLSVAVALLAISRLSSAQTAISPATQVLPGQVPQVVTSHAAPYIVPLPDNQTIKLSILLPLRNQDQLEQLLGRLYDPSSSDYHKFLSVEEFTNEFGPTQDDYNQVVQFATAKGFTVTGQAKNRLVLSIEGTAAQVNSAFHVRISEYEHPTESRSFYAPDREPSVALSTKIAHIEGMNNLYLPHAMNVVPNGYAPMGSVNGSGPGGSYLGSDMRAAYYGGSTLTGLNQTLAVVEFGGYQQSDVDLTFSRAGQTYSVPIENILVGNATNTVNVNDAEQVLDIVQAIGMAPGLSAVQVYIGDPTSTASSAAVLNQIAADNTAKQIGCSWGWILDNIPAQEAILQEMAAQGQTFFAASGDYGAYQASISPFFYPAESQYVTAVGGTHLTTASAGGPWSSEVAWNSNSRGSGGGISPDSIPIPSWQSGLANGSNGGSSTLRNIPDVAAEGDYDNYACSMGTCSGSWAGTSFAAPRWAGFMALVNQQAVEAGNAPLGGIGFIDATLSQIGAGANYNSDFHDIQSGNNDTGGQTLWFNAVPGYDLVTGWGSPTGQALINDLAGPAVPGFWITSSSGTVGVIQGNNATATISVTDAGGFSGSVNLAVSSTLPNGVTASFNPTPTSTSSVLTITASGTAAEGTYPVTITGTSGTITESTTLNLVVHVPTFTLSSAPSSLNLNQGASTTSTITVNDLYGFTGNVSLQASGLPSGVTATFDTNPTGTTSILTLTASNTAASWTGNITITGTSGSLTVSTTIGLVVHTPSFLLSAFPSSVTVNPGASATSTITLNPQYGFAGNVTLQASGLPTGVTASFGTNPAGTTSLLTLTASSTAASWNGYITITGTSDSLSASTQLYVNVVAPSFSLSTIGSISMGQGTSTSTAVYVSPINGFAGNVTLSVSGLPNGVTAFFTPNPVSSQAQMNLTASSAATAGPATLTITGTSGSITVTTTLTLTVNAPGFTLTNYGSSVVLGQGGATSTYIYILDQYGFSGNVTMSASGLPSGVTASFSPNPATYSSQLTLTASGSAALGTYTITVTGTSGSITSSTTFSLTVAIPTFTLNGPTNVTLSQSGSTSAFFYVNSQYGFNGNVTFSLSGLPAGVTANFTQNPTTYSTTVVLTSTATVAIGNYTLTITGTSGSIIKSTTATLSIVAPSIQVSTFSPITLGIGTSNSTTVSVTTNYGFNGSVTFSLTGLPSGITASFSPNPVSLSGYLSTSQLTLTASSSVTAGSYTATLTGTSGTITSSAPITITVAAPSFTLSNSGYLTIGQGGTGLDFVYVNGLNGFNGSVSLSVSGLPSGVTAGFNPNPTTYESTITFSATSAAPAGTYPITVTGTSGSLTATTAVTLTIAIPSFTLSTSQNTFTANEGATDTGYLYLSGTNGFSGAVTLSVSGLPSGVTLTFASNPTTSFGTAMTIFASDSATPGTSTVTISGTSGSTTASTAFTLIIAAPSFTLTPLPGSIVLAPGGATKSSTVTVNPVNGFSGTVSFSISGLPTGVTAAWNPASSSTAGVVTFTTADSAVPGTTTATITGTSGSLRATAQLTVTIQAPAAATTTSLAIASGGSPVSAAGWGSLVTVTATVTSSGSNVTSGLVNFCDSSASYCGDIHLLGSAQLTSAGTASINLRPLPGMHSYKAVFVGTTTFAASSSDASSLQVTGLYPTSTSLTSSGTNGNYTLSATLSAAGPQVPTGSVAFVDTSNSNSTIASSNLVAGTPTLNWAQLTTSPTGAYPGAMVAGDFNGDGISDVAILSTGAGAITILLGNSDGTFTVSPLSPPTSYNPVSISAADFNGDGKLDLAVLTQGGIVDVFLGNGDGTFTAASTSTNLGVQAEGLASGDFNGDGIPDLAIGDSTDSKLVILLGNGDGTFAAATSSPATGFSPNFIVAADLNGDGILDLAVANYQSSSVSILLGNGDGTFTAEPNVLQVAGPTYIAVADFNGDGKPDLAVTSAYSSFLSILLGNGDGTFTAANSPAVNYYTNSVVPIDVNGDGIVDLVSVSTQQSSANVLLGNGDGTFTAGNTAPLPYGATSIATGSVTSSGFPAVVVSLYGQNEAVAIEPYLEQSATAIASGIGLGPAGTHLVGASYSGDSNYAASQSQTVTIVSTKSDSTLTWAAPTPIVYGTPLGSAQLNASANVPGTFVYSPAAGTVLGTGTQTLSVTFTPTDTTNYNPAHQTVQLTVNKAMLTVTANSASLIYGGTVPMLNGTVTGVVPGDGITASYSTTATSSSPAGTYPITATLNDPNSKLGNYSVTNTPGTLTINQATPAITWPTPAQIPYGTPLSATQLDAVASIPGTLTYNPPVGTLPAIGNNTLSVSFTPSDTTDYTTANASVTLTVVQSVPVVNSLSPAVEVSGGNAFTLTVNGAGFSAGSVVYWGSAALVTQYVSGTQITAQVPAASIIPAGVYDVSVQNPAPGGGTSNTEQFEADTAGGDGPPVFASVSATVAPGSTATYPVTLPSAATGVSVSCLNLPAAAECTYSASTGMVSISTSSTTPAGTYEITVVFNETLPGAAAALVLLPTLLLPLGSRRKWRARQWIILLVAGAVLSVVAIGCGGSSGGGGGSGTGGGSPQTHQVRSSGTVSLTVQ